MPVLSIKLAPLHTISRGIRIGGNSAANYRVGKINCKGPKIQRELNEN